MTYQLPYQINNEILNLIVEVSTQLGQVLHYQNLSAYPRLRHNNRIESIHFSLAIEANSLPLGSVRDVIAGKSVTDPAREIQEVKNAYAAYEELEHINPYSLQDLLRIHGIMTTNLVKEAGHFRSCEEGVFARGQRIFMAPPARLVPEEMANLFAWLQKESKNMQPLLLSSIFHYEFVFIHPFADGNGRMARLWQTALLAQWQPLFAYLPVENQIYKYQAEYYEAINQSHRAGASTPFIIFMLKMIHDVLTELMAKDILAESDEYVKRLLVVMEYDIPYKAKELQEKLGLKSTAGLKRNYLDPAIREGLIAMTLPDKPTSRNQKYCRVK